MSLADGHLDRVRALAALEVVNVLVPAVLLLTTVSDHPLAGRLGLLLLHVHVNIHELVRDATR